MHSLDAIRICCDLPPIFYNQLNSKLDIQEAGENLFFGLYNRVNITSVKKLRHKIFIKEQLPPTTDSPKYSPEGGTESKNEKMILIFTGHIAAPSELLTYVRYGCKKDGCGTVTCSCKEYGKAFSYFFNNSLSVELYFISTVNL